MQRKWSSNAAPHRKLQIPPHFDNPQKGEDVKQLQRAINKRLSARRLPGKLKIDGECGRHTITKGRLAARSLGIGLKGDGLTPYAQKVIRHPELRTHKQKAHGKRWVAEHVPPPPRLKVKGNTVTGTGTDREKIVKACLTATDLYYSGKSQRFYSQAGTWTVERGITGEKPGERSDCSQFATSMFWSAGCEDPNRNNYTGGYTGTLGPRGTKISFDELRPGDLILYGTGTYHHVEVFIGDGNVNHTRKDMPAALRDRTVGHGSPPVDFGDIFMMAQAVAIRPFGLTA